MRNKSNPVAIFIIVLLVGCVGLWIISMFGGGGGADPPKTKGGAGSEGPEGRGQSFEIDVSFEEPEVPKSVRREDQDFDSASSIKGLDQRWSDFIQSLKSEEAEKRQTSAGVSISAYFRSRPLFLDEDAQEWFNLSRMNQWRQEQKRIFNSASEAIEGYEWALMNEKRGRLRELFDEYMPPAESNLSADDLCMIGMFAAVEAEFILDPELDQQNTIKQFQDQLKANKSISEIVLVKDEAESSNSVTVGKATKTIRMRLNQVEELKATSYEYFVELGRIAERKLVNPTLYEAPEAINADTVNFRRFLPLPLVAKIRERLVEWEAENDKEPSLFDRLSLGEVESETPALQDAFNQYASFDAGVSFEGFAAYVKGQKRLFDPDPVEDVDSFYGGFKFDAEIILGAMSETENEFSGNGFFGPVNASKRNTLIARANHGSTYSPINRRLRVLAAMDAADITLGQITLNPISDVDDSWQEGRFRFDAEILLDSKLPKNNPLGGIEKLPEAERTVAVSSAETTPISTGIIVEVELFDAHTVEFERGVESPRGKVLDDSSQLRISSNGFVDANEAERTYETRFVFRLKPSRQAKSSQIGEFASSVFGNLSGKVQTIKSDTVPESTTEGQDDPRSVNQLISRELDAFQNFGSELVLSSKAKLALSIPTGIGSTLQFSESAFEVIDLESDLASSSEIEFRLKTDAKQISFSAKHDGSGWKIPDRNRRFASLLPELDDEKLFKELKSRLGYFAAAINLGNEFEFVITNETNWNPRVKLTYLGSDLVEALVLQDGRLELVDRVFTEAEIDRLFDRVRVQQAFFGQELGSSLETRVRIHDSVLQIRFDLTASVELNLEKLSSRMPKLREAYVRIQGELESMTFSNSKRITASTGWISILDTGNEKEQLRIAMPVISEVKIKLPNGSFLAADLTRPADGKWPLRNLNWTVKVELPRLDFHLPLGCLDVRFSAIGEGELKFEFQPLEFRQEFGRWLNVFLQTEAVDVSDVDFGNWDIEFSKLNIDFGRLCVFDKLKLDVPIQFGDLSIGDLSISWIDGSPNLNFDFPVLALPDFIDKLAIDGFGFPDSAYRVVLDDKRIVKGEDGYRYSGNASFQVRQSDQTYKEITTIVIENLGVTLPKNKADLDKLNTDFASVVFEKLIRRQTFRARLLDPQQINPFRLLGEHCPLKVVLTDVAYRDLEWAISGTIEWSGWFEPINFSTRSKNLLDEEELAYAILAQLNKRPISFAGEAGLVEFEFAQDAATKGSVINIKVDVILNQPVVIRLEGDTSLDLAHAVDQPAIKDTRLTAKIEKGDSLQALVNDIESLITKNLRLSSHPTKIKRMSIGDEIEILLPDADSEFDFNLPVNVELEKRKRELKPCAERSDFSIDAVREELLDALTNSLPDVLVIAFSRQGASFRQDLKPTILENIKADFSVTLDCYAQMAFAHFLRYSGNLPIELENVTYSLDAISEVYIDGRLKVADSFSTKGLGAEVKTAVDLLKSSSVGFSVSRQGFQFDFDASTDELKQLAIDKLQSLFLELIQDLVGEKIGSQQELEALVRARLQGKFLPNLPIQIERVYDVGVELDNNGNVTLPTEFSFTFDAAISLGGESLRFVASSDKEARVGELVTQIPAFKIDKEGLHISSKANVVGALPAKSKVLGSISEYCTLETKSISSGANPGGSDWLVFNLSDFKAEVDVVLYAGEINKLLGQLLTHPDIKLEIVEGRKRDDGGLVVTTLSFDKTGIGASRDMPESFGTVSLTASDAIADFGILKIRRANVQVWKDRLELSQVDLILEFSEGDQLSLEVENLPVSFDSSKNSFANILTKVKLNSDQLNAIEERLNAWVANLVGPFLSETTEVTTTISSLTEMTAAIKVKLEIFGKELSVNLALAIDIRRNGIKITADGLEQSVQTVAAELTQLFLQELNRKTKLLQPIELPFASVALQNITLESNQLTANQLTANLKIEFTEDDLGTVYQPVPFSQDGKLLATEIKVVVESFVNTRLTSLFGQVASDSLEELSSLFFDDNLAAKLITKDKSVNVNLGSSLEDSTLELSFSIALQLEAPEKLQFKFDDAQQKPIILISENDPEIKYVYQQEDEQPDLTTVKLAHFAWSEGKLKKSSDHENLTILTRRLAQGTVGKMIGPIGERFVIGDAKLYLSNEVSADTSSSHSLTELSLLGKWSTSNEEFVEWPYDELSEGQKLLSYYQNDEYFFVAKLKPLSTFKFDGEASEFDFSNFDWAAVEAHNVQYLLQTILRSLGIDESCLKLRNVRLANNTFTVSADLSLPGMETVSIDDVVIPLQGKLKEVARSVAIALLNPLLNKIPGQDLEIGGVVFTVSEFALPTDSRFDAIQFSAELKIPSDDPNDDPLVAGATLQLNLKTGEFKVLKINEDAIVNSALAILQRLELLDFLSNSPGGSPISIVNRKIVWKEHPGVGRIPSGFKFGVRAQFKFGNNNGILQGDGFEIAAGKTIRLATRWSLTIPAEVWAGPFRIYEPRGFYDHKEKVLGAGCKVDIASTGDILHLDGMIQLDVRDFSRFENSTKLVVLHFPLAESKGYIDFKTGEFEQTISTNRLIKKIIELDGRLYAKISGTRQLITGDADLKIFTYDMLDAALLIDLQEKIFSASAKVDLLVLEADGYLLIADSNVRVGAGTKRKLGDLDLVSLRFDVGERGANVEAKVTIAKVNVFFPAGQRIDLDKIEDMLKEMLRADKALEALLSGNTTIQPGSPYGPGGGGNGGGGEGEGGEGEGGEGEGGDGEGGDGEGGDGEGGDGEGGDGEGGDGEGGDGTKPGENQQAENPTPGQKEANSGLASNGGSWGSSAAGYPLDLIENSHVMRKLVYRNRKKPEEGFRYVDDVAVFPYIKSQKIKNLQKYLVPAQDQVPGVSFLPGTHGALIIRDKQFSSEVFDIGTSGDYPKGIITWEMALNREKFERYRATKIEAGCFVLPENFQTSVKNDNGYSVSTHASMLTYFYRKYCLPHLSNNYRGAWKPKEGNYLDLRLNENVTDPSPGTKPASHQAWEGNAFKPAEIFEFFEQDGHIVGFTINEAFEEHEQIVAKIDDYPLWIFDRTTGGIKAPFKKDDKLKEKFGSLVDEANIAAHYEFYDTLAETPAVALYFDDTNNLYNGVFSIQNGKVLRFIEEVKQNQAVTTKVEDYHYTEDLRTFLSDDANRNDIEFVDRDEIGIYFQLRPTAQDRPLSEITPYPLGALRASKSAMQGKSFAFDLVRNPTDDPTINTWLNISKLRNVKVGNNSNLAVELLKLADSARLTPVGFAGGSSFEQALFFQKVRSQRRLIHIKHENTNLDTTTFLANQELWNHFKELDKSNLLTYKVIGSVSQDKILKVVGVDNSSLGSSRAAIWLCTKNKCSQPFANWANQDNVREIVAQLNYEQLNAILELSEPNLLPVKIKMPDLTEGDEASESSIAYSCWVNRKQAFTLFDQSGNLFSAPIKQFFLDVAGVGEFELATDQPTNVGKAVLVHELLDDEFEKPRYPLWVMENGKDARAPYLPRSARDAELKPNGYTRYLFEGEWLLGNPQVFDFLIGQPAELGWIPIRAEQSLGSESERYTSIYFTNTTDLEGFNPNGTIAVINSQADLPNGNHEIGNFVFGAAPLLSEFFSKHEEIDISAHVRVDVDDETTVSLMLNEDSRRSFAEMQKSRTDLPIFPLWVARTPSPFVAADTYLIPILADRQFGVVRVDELAIGKSQFLVLANRDGLLESLFQSVLKKPFGNATANNVYLMTTDAKKFSEGVWLFYRDCPLRDETSTDPDETRSLQGDIYYCLVDEEQGKTYHVNMSQQANLEALLAKMVESQPQEALTGVFWEDIRNNRIGYLQWAGPRDSQRVNLKNGELDPRSSASPPFRGPDASALVDGYGYAFTKGALTSIRTSRQSRWIAYSLARDQLIKRYEAYRGNKMVPLGLSMKELLWSAVRYGNRKGEYSRKGWKIDPVQILSKAGIKR